MGSLYLIPTTLGESDTARVIPSEVSVIIKSIRYFIVENIRTARRYLRKIDPQLNIDELQFFELNQHTAFVFYSAFYLSKEAWAFISGGLFYILFIISTFFV